MHDQTLPYYVGLDIGTSTVRCIVGILDHNDPTKPSIIGYGSAANNGMRKGSVVFADDVADAVSKAVAEAERLSGKRVNTVTVNVNGAHVEGLNSRGVIAISAANREINDEDRMRVEEAATIVQLPPNREIVQVFAKNYFLDGQSNIKDPVGMHGVRLEVDTHIVTASIANLRMLDSALEKAQIIVNNHTLSGLAAAEAVLSRQQKESGTLLLDIGAGTTNFVVLEEGEVQHVAVLPIGGMHITNDLAIGLKTDLDIAEKVKIEHATLEQQKGKKETVSITHSGQNLTFSTNDIAMITEARVDELFDYIEKELKHIGRSRKLPGGVVLVGGTAKLPGLAEFAKEKLQLAARVGKLNPVGGLVEKVSDPSTYTAVGLMLLDMLLPVRNEDMYGRGPNTKILDSVSRLWRSVIK